MSFFGLRDITVRTIGSPVIAIERNVVPFTRPAKRESVTVHPVLTQADISRMSAHELAYFTDTPVSHVVAFRDFERDLMLERRQHDSVNAVIARGAADRRQMGRW
jgi:hypothetical protein